MLTRLILKLLFKALTPLIALAGVLSYGFYLQGGDPGALWRTAAGKIGQSLQSTSDSALGGVADLGQSIRLGHDNGTTGGSGLVSVYSWTDATGVTHYGDRPPPDVVAATHVVDTRRNVLVGSSAAPSRSGARSSRTSTNAYHSPTANPEALPGIAGVLPGSGGSPGRLDADGSISLPEGVDLNAILNVLQSRDRLQ